MQYSESTLTVPGSPFPASLTFYGPDHRHMIHPGELFPAVLICPGGAYAWNSDREAEPVALCFLSMGFNIAFQYSLTALILLGAVIADVMSRRRRN